MTILNGIVGTAYFFYIGTLGYWTDYNKHVLFRDKCSEQWNKKPEPKDKDKAILYVKETYGEEKKDNKL